MILEKLVNKKNLISHHDIIQCRIKVEMLNFHFNTTLDYIYEFILKSYQSGTKTLSRSDAETSSA